jgi:hypothetical protein
MLQDADSLGQDIKEGALRSGILWKEARVPLFGANIEDES